MALVPGVPTALTNSSEARLISKITPKIFIISLVNVFPPFSVHTTKASASSSVQRPTSVPGLSPLFPDAHCTEDGVICQLTTGEAEINAALSLSALIRSPSFDLRTTYFMIAGIAGINPKVATLASVTFARYAVQVCLQYEFDAREIPPNFPTGYVPLGSTEPGQYPSDIYGTEVFEVNDALRKLAVGFAQNTTLNDSAVAQAYRAHYSSSEEYVPGASPPSVVECDTAASDTFWTGQLLGETFENTTTLFTNGTGVYCSTQQEDNALLEALLRGAKDELVDFARIIVMRTGSNFDRQYPGQTATENRFSDSGGFVPALANIYIAGVKVILGILDAWEETFAEGVPPTNYVGDILGTLGGEPDFGPISPPRPNMPKFT
ncbi:hypothetical protein E4T56_gene12209 [Termitomyces sp. T112]|nr:hypothetical protein E4T56_gene12209 [Termitomyces sp. T112]